MQQIANLWKPEELQSTAEAISSKFSFGSLIMVAVALNVASVLCWVMFQ